MIKKNNDNYELVEIRLLLQSILFIIFYRHNKMPFECGKIQYLQEKQGFIRCSRKVNGKRDIIFFREEVEPSLQSKLKLGLIVQFEVYTGGSRTNIRGGTITHWAKITGIQEKEQTVLNSDAQYLFSTPANDCTLSVLSDTEQEIGYCSNWYLDGRNYIQDDSLLRKRNSKPTILSYLLADVYRNLYDQPLYSPPEGALRNCWQA